MAWVDAEKWRKTVLVNSPPSWGDNPESWPEEIAHRTEDARKAYAYTVIVFAERWADEMERRGIATQDLGNVAEMAARQVHSQLGRWGLTGFQYGCAVSILAECWIHGEALRRWHNLKTQVGSEGEDANRSGGVLNPALLSAYHQDPDRRDLVCPTAAPLVGGLQTAFLEGEQCIDTSDYPIQ